MSDIRKDVEEFICKHLERCNFERLKHNTCKYFGLSKAETKTSAEHKEELIELNKEQCSLMPMEEIVFLAKLKDYIERSRIQLMDEDSMVAFEASGFAYDMDGDIVIMNPR